MYYYHVSFETSLTKGFGKFSFESKITTKNYEEMLINMVKSIRESFNLDEDSQVIIYGFQLLEDE